MLQSEGASLASLVSATPRFSPPLLDATARQDKALPQRGHTLPWPRILFMHRTYTRDNHTRTALGVLFALTGFLIAIWLGYHLGIDMCIRREGEH